MNAFSFALITYGVTFVMAFFVAGVIKIIAVAVSRREKRAAIPERSVR